MNTEFDKQWAVCRHYHKKTGFWHRILLWELVAVVLALAMDWGMIYWGLVIVFVATYIPATVRLVQYSRAVNKLDEL